MPVRPRHKRHWIKNGILSKGRITSNFQRIAKIRCSCPASQEFALEIYVALLDANTVLNFYQ